MKEASEKQTLSFCLSLFPLSPGDFTSDASFPRFSLSSRCRPTSILPAVAPHVRDRASPSHKFIPLSSIDHLFPPPDASRFHQIQSLLFHLFQFNTNITFLQQLQQYLGSLLWNLRLFCLFYSWCFFFFPPVIVAAALV